MVFIDFKEGGRERKKESDRNRERDRERDQVNCFYSFFSQLNFLICPYIEFCYMFIHYHYTFFYIFEHGYNNY